MPVLDLAFEWPVDDAGYKIVTHETAKLSGPHIVRRSGHKGPLRIIRPLEINRALFEIFADLDGSDESCLGFANSFGYLGMVLDSGAAVPVKPLGMFLDSEANDRVGPQGESLELWRREIDVMRRAVAVKKANPDALTNHPEITITELAVSLVRIDGKPTLRMRPTSLIGAIRLQFAHAVSTNLDIRTCGHCGKMFEAGGSGRTRKARFCSDRCRVDFHIARRKKL